VTALRKFWPRRRRRSSRVVRRRADTEEHHEVHSGIVLTRPRLSSRAALTEPTQC
jgi:hypothetical protein